MSCLFLFGSDVLLSLSIFVEGLLNSCPRVCLLLDDFAVFGLLRATRTFVAVIIDVPPQQMIQVD